ncbi:MAG: NAD(P)/FAD-dependent oxidoreductase [Oscillospiraceae bacterium]|jgi:2,4-dienoyl-CoA reductase-like NADH-dependent reductase (Old Yellow Enzyme family)/thioredoxin reductase|nr:NAD(P)/FAD-dependent oxidoreductase [Oscillospiraceae bacterium]
MFELKYPHLFAPIRLGNTVFRNRIFGAPTGYQDLTAEKFPPPEAVAYYARKASGGAATVAVGECVVDSLRGKGSADHIPLDNPGVLGSLTLLADGISRHGAVAVAELQHAGMYAEESARRGNAIYGPVAVQSVVGQVAHVDGGGTQALAMTESVIYETIEAYADAALRAKQSGFGMVLIHGGHGWLLSQFLSPQLNTRDDMWGGSLENRVRLPIAIAKRIREKCGRGFPIEFRMSATEANPNGYGLDEGVKIAIALDGHVDLLHCSAGHHEVRDAFVVTHPSMFLPDGANAYLAAEVKKHVKTPVATVGAFTDPAHMEEVLASGGADVIELARELIADPDMPIKARMGRDGDITKCMRCFTCFSNLLNTKQFSCAVNPEIGAELAVTQIPDAKFSRTVLVAGGGVAGMEAALTAAERGHRVILCEKSSQLGGALRCETNVPFKAKLSQYLDLQARRVAEAGVDIRLNTPVTTELARELAPDAIIAALGATPVKPQIEGISLAIGAEEVYLNPELAGERVAILGGGLVGTELAIYLASRKKQNGESGHVVLIEQLPELSDGGNQLHGLALDVQLRELPIIVSTSTKVLKIQKNAEFDVTDVICEQTGDATIYHVDTVIYAVGQRPLWDATDALRDCAPEFYEVGDCTAPKNIRAATKSAYFAATAIGRI